MPADFPSSLLALAIILGTALVIMLLGPTRYYTKRRAHMLALVAVIVSLFLIQADTLTVHAGYVYPAVFSKMLLFDTYSALFMTLFLLGALMTLTIGKAYIDQAGFFRAESFALLLFALFGMMVLSQANELFTAFIALEIASMAIYILVGLHRSDARAAEAFFKYLVLGAFMGSFYLLGMLLIYAQTGSTQLAEIAAYIAGHEGAQLNLVITGGMLIMVTIMFKIAAVPFGIWVLDVYEGASLPITAFMAGAFKVAVFAITLRIFLIDFNLLGEIYDPLLILATVVTLIAGSLIAVVQNSVVRMLAASSIVHGGYLLIGLTSAGELGSSAASAILFYLVAYMLSAIGSFGILSYISRGYDSSITYEELKGLSVRHPLIAASLSIFMLSLAGFPSTIGFLGKFYIFTSAIESGYTLLALLGALAAFVSIYYYFKVIAMLYFYPAEETKDLSGYPVSFLFILLGAVAVLWGGIGTGLISFLPGADVITEIVQGSIGSLFILEEG